MLYTSQFNYKGVDRYDITAKTANLFAPSWEMVMQYKETGDKVLYTAHYQQKMQQSYKDYTLYWKETVRMCTEADITLVCYCASGDFCHRVLLAGYLQKCGATYGGER